MAGDGTGSPTITFASRLSDGTRLGKASFDEFQQFSALLEGYFKSLGANANGTFGNIVVESIQVVPNFGTMPAPAAGSIQVFSPTNHLVATITGVDDSPLAGQRVMLIDQSGGNVGIRLLTDGGDMFIGRGAVSGPVTPAGPGVWFSNYLASSVLTTLDPQWSIGGFFSTNGGSGTPLGIFDATNQRMLVQVCKNFDSLGALTYLVSPDITNFAPTCSVYLGDRRATGNMFTEIAGLLLYGRDGVQERSRTVAMGEWTTRAFSAGNFTANGAMTWTVGSGDVSQDAYMLVGKTMTYAFTLITTTVGGTPDTTLQITIPGSFTAAKLTQNAAIFTPAGAYQIGRIRVAAGGTVIQLQILNGGGPVNWTGGTNDTEVSGQITFEVQ